MIELLTVIAVIGVLAAILMPTVGAVRTKAAATQSASNVRQLGAALQLYLQENKYKLPTVTSENGGPWDRQLAPYLGIRLLEDGSFPKPAEALLFHRRDKAADRTECRRTYAMNHPSYIGNANLNSLPVASVRNPSQVMIFTERPFVGGVAGQVNGAGVATPQNQLDWQTDLNGDGRFNYCFIDGHVESRVAHDPSMIGTRGRVDAPRGRWTLEEGD